VGGRHVHGRSITFYSPIESVKTRRGAARSVFLAGRGLATLPCYLVP